MLEMVSQRAWIKREDVLGIIQNARIAAKRIRDNAPRTVDNSDRNLLFGLAKKLEDQAADLQTALNGRDKALAFYTRTIESNAPAAALSAAFDDIQKTNLDVANHYDISETTLTEEQKGRHAILLASLQLPRILYIGLTRPPHHRFFVETYYSGATGIPLAAIGNLRRRLSRPTSGIELTRLRIQEGNARLTGELGGADAGAGSLESRAELQSSESGLSEDAKRARQRYRAEKALFDIDERTLRTQEAVENSRREINRLKKAGTHMSDPVLQQAEQTLARHETELKNLRWGRLKAERGAIESASEEFYGRVESARNQALKTGDKPRAFERRDWQELDDLARRGAENNRALAAAGAETLEEIRAAQRSGASPETIKALQAKLEDTVGRISTNQKGAISRLSKFLDAVRGKSRNKGGLMPGEEKQFRRTINTVLHWQEKEGKAGIGHLPLCKTFRGKFIFYGLTFGAAPALIGLATKDKKTSWGRAAGQAAVDIAPVTGTLSDFYAAATGNEVISGRKVTGYERWLMRPLFGMVGLASDILLLAGVGVAMRGGVSVMRAGVEGSRLAKVTEEVAKQAAKESAEVAAEGAARKATDTALKGPTFDFLRKMQRGGAIAAVTIGAGSLALTLAPKDWMPIPESIRNIMGPELEEVDADQTTATGELAEADEELDEAA
jgi:hypothetical protein